MLRFMTDSTAVIKTGAVLAIQKSQLNEKQKFGLANLDLKKTAFILRMDE